MLLLCYYVCICTVVVLTPDHMLLLCYYVCICTVVALTSDHTRLMCYYVRRHYTWWNMIAFFELAQAASLVPGAESTQIPSHLNPQRPP